MAYVAQAIYQAATPGRSANATVTETAYQVLAHYFPASAAGLTTLHDAALATIPDGPAKRDGIRRGDRAAAGVLCSRAGDGLQTPIASTSPFPALPPEPGI